MKTTDKHQIGWIILFWIVWPVVLNLVALLFFKKASAEFFSATWWSVWFPIYAVAFTIGIIRIGRCYRQKPDDTKADA